MTAAAETTMENVACCSPSMSNTQTRKVLLDVVHVPSPTPLLPIMTETHISFARRSGKKCRSESGDQPNPKPSLIPSSVVPDLLL